MKTMNTWLHPEVFRPMRNSLGGSYERHHQGLTEFKADSIHCSLLILGEAHFILIKLVKCDLPLLSVCWLLLRTCLLFMCLEMVPRISCSSPSWDWGEAGQSVIPCVFLLAVFEDWSDICPMSSGATIDQRLSRVASQWHLPAPSAYVGASLQDPRSQISPV